ncbi:hypothetical protein [Nocardioides sediminis]|uniref:hypothetical protein n=1 Tax=Nocardioides sediminis TaxID=433648 RepID=UPI000D322492|nr:hypothetical protein [Nocardioides sediminis]
MPPTRADRAATRLLTAAALLLAVVGCALDGDREEAPQGEAAQQLADRMEEVLDRRATALRTGDEGAFMTTVGRRSVRFVARERTYADNLAQLPVSRLSYRVDPATIAGDDGRWKAEVEIGMQLEGYDEAPVVRPARFSFAEDPDGDGLVVVGDRDRGWERRHEVTSQPWDTGSIVVREGDGVPGVFDDASVASAEQVLREVETGIGAVGAVVPHEWSGRVVLYALSDTGVLEGVEGLPGEDPDDLDAVTFSVATRPGSERVAGNRFVLHPRMLSAAPDRLARLVRHELTHVAVGERDDEVWTWLAEGIAEWVSVQPMAPEDRLLPRAAVEAAAAGPDSLPPDDGFHGPDQGAHYGLSWWACQAIVDLRGERPLWRLLDRLAATSPADRVDELEQVLGMSAGRLAREAARRILATYS